MTETTYVRWSKPAQGDKRHPNPRKVPDGAPLPERVCGGAGEARHAPACMRLLPGVDPMVDSKERALAAVRVARDVLDEAEEHVAVLRDGRNLAAAAAMQAGATERQVAQAAGVSATYAHRIAVGAGIPATGHEMDAEREGRA